MVINKFTIISSIGYKHLNIFEDKNIHKVVIDGANIQSEFDVFSIITESFKLPELITSWDILLDYMRDLYTLNAYEGILLIIENFDKMLVKDSKTMSEFIDCFANYILPFWESEVLNTVVDGKLKSFNIYAISNVFEYK